MGQIEKKVDFRPKIGIVYRYSRKEVSMFISAAIAQTANTATQAATTAPMSGMLTQLILVVLIVYFVLIRPQQKRIKKHEAELNAIIKGTKVIVAGIMGRVVEVQSDNKLLVELSDGVEVTVLRPYVSQVIFETPAQKK